MPSVRVDGIEIYYEVAGSGEPLLLIAGFGCDHAIWTLVANELASRFTVYVFDNRGMGRSTGADSRINIQQMAMDAAGLIDSLGLSSVHVAGHSMGGMIAQELALARPEKVRSLVLLSSCSQQDNRGKAIIRSWGELPSVFDVETSTRLILPWIYTEAFYAAPGLIEGLIALILANPEPPAPAVLRGQAGAICEFDSSERLGGIRCPTLVVVGDLDILLPPAVARRLAARILGSELIVLEGTAHGLLIETPQQVAQAMRAFLLRQT